jgi:hypothetical protein
MCSRYEAEIQIITTAPFIYFNIFASRVVGNQVSCGYYNATREARQGQRNKDSATGIKPGTTRKGPLQLFKRQAAGSGKREQMVPKENTVFY